MAGAETGSEPARATRAASAGRGIPAIRARPGGVRARPVPRLRRSDCAAPGIARRRRGRGFEYRDPDGGRVDDPQVLERIAALAIPPAWREVWICLDPQGHLQATGIDAAGRKQYRYHERWRAHRDRRKFDDDDRVRPRASPPASPRRPRPRRERRRAASSRECSPVLVRLLDLGFFRIGSEDYAERNESYGLITMQKRHVTIADGQVIFDYTAKSGVRRVQAIADEDVPGTRAGARRRRGGGPQLLAHRVGRSLDEVHAERRQRLHQGASPAATSPPRTSGPGTPPSSPRSRSRSRAVKAPPGAAASAQSARR